MKITKNEKPPSYFIEDIVLKDLVRNSQNNLIIDAVAEKLEQLAERYGWQYKRKEQMFFQENGNGETPLIILSCQKVCILAEPHTKEYKRGMKLISVLYKNTNYTN